MSLVIGDVHGRLEKARKFLEYKPEEQHIFTGDYVDSFHASDEDILNTLKLVIESEAILVLGNHDVHYLANPPFMCSGHNHYLAKGINEILESFLDHFTPATEVDGFVITHGGISAGLSKRFIKAAMKENSVVEILTAEWNEYLKTRKKGSVIFNIPQCRGGSDPFGGIFWADYRDEDFYNIPQIFGHSKTYTGIITPLNKNHWAVGCDSSKSECFNTSTKEVEKF